MPVEPQDFIEAKDTALANLREKVARLEAANERKAAALKSLAIEDWSWHSRGQNVRGRHCKLCDSTWRREQTNPKHADHCALSDGGEGWLANAQRRWHETQEGHGPSPDYCDKCLPVREFIAALARPGGT